MDQKTLYVQKQRYRYLAYIVIRDAIGFYFGIPKFISEENLQQVYNKALDEKLKSLKVRKNRELSVGEINKQVRAVKKSLLARKKELEEDLKACNIVLFKDNEWLQHLDLNPEFFKSYLDKLDETTKCDLAVVPKWGTRDHSLGRPYINDNFNCVTGF